MKNNIRYLLFAAILFMTTLVNAQTIGIRAGLNMPRVAVKIFGQDKSDNLETKLGFHVGLSLQIPVSPMFKLETGLLLSTKGYKESETHPDFNYVETFNPYYIELPILLRTGIDLGGPNLIIQAGPYIAMGVGGSFSQEFTEMGQTEKETMDIEWGSENGEVSQFDFGISMGAGLEFNNFQVLITYGLGLANLGNNAPDDSYIKNRVLGLSLGYNFNKGELE